MRIPEQAPDWMAIARQRAPEVFAALRNAPYREVIDDASTAYRHWNKIRFIARAKEIDPELVWANVKIARKVQARATPFKGADGSSIHYTVPDQVARELMHLDQDAAGRVTAEADVRMPTGSQRERFILRALTEEAIASSMLEGAATTRQDARQMITSGRQPRTTGERMVLNNYRTMLFIREHADAPLSPDLLLELQSMLTADTLDDPRQSGRLRSPHDPVRIEDNEGNTIYTPPPASELPDRLDVLCRFANQPQLDPHFIHPIVRAILLHFQIAIDHPFCDGNGRTARAVFYWYALRHKYWLFEFMPISTLIREGPSQYATAFLYTETDDYDATYFLLYQARVLRRSRLAMNDYLRRKLAEQTRAAGALSADADLNLRQRQILLKFARDADRQTTIDAHAADFRVSYQTARTDLLDLANRGYLSSFKDGRTYVFIRGERLNQAELPE